MFDIVWRTLLAFVMLLGLTRLLGKKQLSQLTVFTYITGIALGNMASEMVLHEVPILSGIVAMVLWSLLVFVIEWVSLKSPRARVLMDGEPTIVIKKGIILEEALRKQRLNLDDLTMQLRLEQVFSVTEVEYGILEPNGAITVMKKTGCQGALPAEIIADGKIVEKNLKELGVSLEWVMGEMLRQGIMDVRDVFYGELQGDRSLYLQRRGLGSS